MNIEKKLDAEEEILMKQRSGVSPHTEEYAALTLKLEKIKREREIISTGIDRKDAWRLFSYSQIIPLVALGLSILALVKSCDA